MSVIKIESHNDYEVLTLNRGKANPINTELCEAVLNELNRIDKDDNVRGLIITGNSPGYFSVGLDLKELYYYDEKEIENFWTVWDKMVMTLVKFRKPLISAVNGYSPAGGCVIAVTCDYRVMADDEKFMIGLNETNVGIIVPEYIFLLYQYWIGKNAAFQHLMNATLHNPAQALEVGLVNEICDVHEVLDRAKAKMESWLLKPDSILYNSKVNLKAQLVKELEDIQPIPQELKLKAWFDPKSRAVMGALVAQLSK